MVLPPFLRLFLSVAGIIDLFPPFAKVKFPQKYGKILR